MYAIAFTTSADRALQRLSENVQRRIVRAVETLSDDPRLPPDTPRFDVSDKLSKILNRDLKAAGVAKRDDRGRILVGRETAGRRGKGVTTGFDHPLDESGLRQLAATLKQRCGTGATVKDGRIEIQGDQRQRIVAELEKLGCKVQRVGG